MVVSNRQMYCLLYQQDEAEEDRRFAYHTEWNDQASGMVMALTMLHWPHREEVELVSACPQCASSRFSVKTARCELQTLDKVPSSRKIPNMNIGHRSVASLPPRNPKFHFCPCT